MSDIDENTASHLNTFPVSDTEVTEVEDLDRGYISLVIQEVLRWSPSPPQPPPPGDNLFPLDGTVDWGPWLLKETLCINASCHDMGLSYFYETWTGLFLCSWSGTLLEGDDWMTLENGRDYSLPLNNERSKVIVAEDTVRALLLRFNGDTQYSARDKVPPDIIH